MQVLIQNLCIQICKYNHNKKLRDKLNLKKRNNVSCNRIQYLFQRNNNFKHVRSQ